MSYLRSAGWRCRLRPIGLPARSPRGKPDSIKS
jgi:hypothetical protein